MVVRVTAVIGPVALEDMACSAVETLLALIKHRKTCGQCQIDEMFCETAQTYQQLFMQDVRRYARAKGGKP